MEQQQQMIRLYKAIDTSPDDFLALRMAKADKIAECAKSGTVTVLENGRDCDGVVYSGRRHVIPASVIAYERLYDDTLEWADGPFWFYIAAPWEVEESEYTSRDTYAEAMNY